MAIKVHGIPLSTATIRVLGCLHEKDLDYQLVTVNVPGGEHKRQPFLSLNPFGQVPGFEDGDLKLFESRAINKYVAQAYAGKGNPLIVEDPKKMAIVSAWMEVEAHQFDPAAAKLTWELAVKPAIGMTTDEAVVGEWEPKLAKVLDVYEERLGQSKYLGGDCFTLADLHHLPNVSYLMRTKIKALFESRPHVGAWAADILARPSWKKVIEMQTRH